MSIEKYVKEIMGHHLTMLKTLTAIPAPSGKEEKRANWILDYVRSLGYDDAYVDEAKNVICEIEGADPSLPVYIYMAHTDTVFPDEEEMPVREEKGILYGPGVGDDTANVCAVLTILRYIKEQGLGSRRTQVFVLDSCEEGLGNLKGSRAIMEAYKGRIGQVISFDLGYDTGYDWAVGSARYRLDIATRGGHSLEDFGNTNAITVAAEVITALYKMDVSHMPGLNTYNVGMIQGGTSVNTIAQDASFLFEYRSDTMKGLRLMKQAMDHSLAPFIDRQDASLTVTALGERPAMGDVDPEKMRLLREQISRIVCQKTGILPAFKKGSTDCNIPLSMGIPAICIGVYLGGGAHTRQEYLHIESLGPGLEAALAIVQFYYQE